LTFTVNIDRYVVISAPLVGASHSSRRLAYCPAPAVSLCVSPNLCWVLVAPLGGWLVNPLALSAFAAFPVFIH
jgi:hypothetical protein